MASPTLVLIKANGCPACTTLAPVWDECVRQMKEIIPSLNIVVINKPGIRAPIDANSYPGILSVFDWFPATLLVPGNVWENAMTKLGSGIMEPLPGSQILNGHWTTGTTVQQHVGRDIKYHFTKPVDYKRWIMAAVSSEDYKRASTTAITTLPTLPIISADSGREPQYIASQSRPCGIHLIPKIGYHAR